jgi:hypothetical protein
MLARESLISFCAVGPSSFPRKCQHMRNKLSALAHSSSFGPSPWTTACWSLRACRTSGFTDQQQSQSLGSSAQGLRSHASVHHKCALAGITRGLVHSHHEHGVVRIASPESLFPFKEGLVVDDVCLTADEVIEYLCALQSSARLRRVLEVCANRTFDLVPIIEGTLPTPSLNSLW